MAEGVPAGANGQPDDDFAQRHPRALTLTDPAHVEAVQAFAKQLAAKDDVEVDGRGLYDDTGALIRYLRARQWNLGAAEEMIRHTARWRKEFDLAGLREGAYVADVAKENHSGKLYARGFDRRGRVALYMKPRNEHSTEVRSNVRHLTYCVERAVACMDRREREGTYVVDENDTFARKFVLLIDFSDYSMKNMLPIAAIREVITILQDHYPERLGQAFIADAPWMMSTVFNIISAFVDPVTREKFQFVDVGPARALHMSKYFDLDQVEPIFGGSQVIPFDSHDFLNVKLGSSPMGVDYSEQVEIKAAAMAKAQQGSEVWQGTSPQVYWGILSDQRVMTLTRDERSVVRGLARALAEQMEGKFEPHGLFDDAGVLIRYLRAHSWDARRAESKIRATAHWRSTFEFAKQRAGAFDSVIAGENASGRMYVRGYDKYRRPIIYLKFCHKEVIKHTNYLRHFVYCVERAVALLEREENLARKLRSIGHVGEDGVCTMNGVRTIWGKFVLIADFQGYSPRARPRLPTLFAALRILREHYPGRLGEAFVLHPRWQVSAFWKLFPRLLEPACSVTFVSSIDDHREHFDVTFNRSTLEVCAGGKNRLKFNSRVFLTVPVYGDVYGAEFDEQLAAHGVSPNEEIEEEDPREAGAEPSSATLDGLFGGGDSPLW